MSVRAGRGGAASGRPRGAGRTARAGTTSGRTTGPAGSTGGLRRTRGVASRPAAARPGSAPSAATAANVAPRRPGRTAAVRIPAPTSARLAKSGLAKQIAALGLVICAVALTLALPLRNYLAQRADLAANISQQQGLETQLGQIAEQQQALSDPAFIKSEARRRLQYVQPGDTVFVVDAPLPKASAPAAPRAAVQTPPWYSTLWDTLARPPAPAMPTGGR